MPTAAISRWFATASRLCTALRCESRVSPLAGRNNCAEPAVAPARPSRARPGASGARVVAVVDREDVRRGSNAREALAERGKIFPVQRAPPAIEKPGLGDEVRPEADATDGDARPRGYAQPAHRRAVAAGL